MKASAPYGLRITVSFVQIPRKFPFNPLGIPVPAFSNPLCRIGEKPIESKKLSWSQKIAIALRGGWDTLRPIFWYLIIGVALGAVIYGYMPSDWVLKIAGPDNPFAVPVAAIIGVPLYVRAETAIPIGVALMGKGMSIGAVIALVSKYDRP